MDWDTSTDPIIVQLNEKHFVAEEGGKTRVYNEKWDRVLERHFITTSTFGDYRNLYLNKFAEIETKNSRGKINTKFVDQGDYWLRHPERREYNEIIFEPLAASIKGVKNLWRGYAITPSAEGSWELLNNHIRNNICDGNDEYHNFYLDWWANVIQKPGEQGNVAVVMKGNRGVGKGTAIGYFAELLGQHYIYVVSSKQVTGNFNLHLRDAVVLFSDEAVFAGDPAATSVLKSMVTEKYLPIEGKGRDLIMARNNLHIIMATNNRWAAPSGPDERRFFILNVKDDPAIKQNTKYFNAIKLQMNNGGRARLLHDLINRDIKKYDSYTAPKTAGLLEQKIESFDSLQAWWYEKLNNGYLFDGIEWESEVPAEAVFIDYINRSKDHNNKYRDNSVALGIFLSCMTPKSVPAVVNDWPRTRRFEPAKFFVDNKLLLTFGPSKKHYAFPPLQTCREIFEQIIGHKINWPIQLRGEAQVKTHLEKL